MLETRLLHCGPCPITLTTTRRTPPIALLLAVPRRNPPNVVFKRESVTTWAYVRQSDSNLTFDWHDDPPQEVRALLQNLLRNALSAVVFLFHIIVAFSHFHTCPNAESAICQELFQELSSNRLTSPHCILGASVSHRSENQCCAAKKKSSSLYGVSRCHLPSAPISSQFLHLPKPFWPTLF